MEAGGPATGNTAVGDAGGVGGGGGGGGPPEDEEKRKRREARVHVGRTIQ